MNVLSKELNVFYTNIHLAFVPRCLTTSLWAVSPGRDHRKKKDHARKTEKRKITPEKQVYHSIYYMV